MTFFSYFLHSSLAAHLLLSVPPSCFFPPPFDSGRKNSLKIELLGRMFLGHQDPDIGISRRKTLCKWPFSFAFDREWLGYPGIWVGTSQIWKKLYAGKLWADFSFPIANVSTRHIHMNFLCPLLFGSVSEISQLFLLYTVDSEWKPDLSTGQSGIHVWQKSVCARV